MKLSSTKPKKLLLFQEGIFQGRYIYIYISFLLFLFNYISEYFAYIFSKKYFYCISGKWNFLALSLKNFLYFRRGLSKLKKLKKAHSEKISYISVNKTF